EPFVLCRNNFITPVMRFRRTTNVAPKHSQRVAMVAIAGNYLPGYVAAGKEDCNDQSGCGPKVGTPSWGVRPAQRADLTRNLCRQKQTKRRNSWKNSINPLGRN